MIPTIDDKEFRSIEERLQHYYDSTTVDGGKAIGWIDKGIQKAKYKQKRQWQPWLVCGMTMALLGIIIVPNMDHIIAMVPRIGTMAMISSDSIVESTGQTRLHIDQPMIQEENSVEANTDIDHYVRSLVDQYHLDTVDASFNYDLTSKYTVVTDNHRYLSIRFNTSVVMAGASSTVRTFTIDKGSGEVVSLYDVLGQDQTLLQRISDEIKRQMKQRMDDDPNQVYWLDDEVDEWNFEGLDGNESFYFDDQDQLVIEFDEYDVAPGYMGIVSFTIPLDVSGDLVNP